jgi:hypothetical protein
VRTSAGRRLLQYTSGVAVHMQASQGVPGWD